MNKPFYGAFLLFNSDFPLDLRYSIHESREYWVLLSFCRADFFSEKEFIAIRIVLYWFLARCHLH